jgi:hypothetical protein
MLGFRVVALGCQGVTLGLQVVKFGFQVWDSDAPELFQFRLMFQSEISGSLFLGLHFLEACILRLNIRLLSFKGSLLGFQLSLQGLHRVLVLKLEIFGRLFESVDAFPCESQFFTGGVGALQKNEPQISYRKRETCQKSAMRGLFTSKGGSGVFAAGYQQRPRPM